MHSDVRISVVICSVGRPECLSELVPFLANQTRPADQVLFVVTKQDDIGFDPKSAFGGPTDVAVLISKKGLPRQRNTSLNALAANTDVVVFFDDDFLPSRYALEGILRAFKAHPEVNGMTGHLLADGINSTGISGDQARQMIANWDASLDTQPSETHSMAVVRRGLEGLYGCNMAYRVAAIGETRFDEALPLYGWQEDIDFAARIGGDRIKTDAFAGVHRGAKSGRETTGKRLGYSQIVNPWYLIRKGSMTPRFGLRLMLRNFLANHAKSLKPEPWIDRRGRMRGNWIGLFHIVTGRANPAHILSM